MKLVAIILLAGVFIRHNAVNLIAQMTGATPASVYYIFGGAWESILCAVVFLVSMQMRLCIWRRIIQASMLIGMIEGMQATTCRLAISDIHAVPRGVDLCDYVTGIPFGSVVMSVYFLILLWSLAHEPTTA